MKAYKLTDINSRTKNTQWGPGVSHTAAGRGEKLCSDSWIHFYKDPLIAVLMNPIHAAFDPFLMWECETSEECFHEPLKSGCKVLRTLKIIEAPVVTPISRIAFGILCAQCIASDKTWGVWATGWLNGSDRTAAHAVYIAAGANIAVDAYIAADAYTAYAAYCAARAAYCAAHAAAHDANASFYVAKVAANAAANTDSNIPFEELAKQAIKIT